MADYIHNSKARFNYDILDEYEAGIELVGQEVKSIREKHGRIESAHVIVRGGEVFLVGMDLPPFQANNERTLYDPMRTRKLLLKKKEAKALSELEKGLTIVPLALYNKGTKIKIKIGVAKGKKKFDKRETIKKRETDREIRRVVKEKR
jgi:SsrA-binding protein